MDTSFNVTGAATPSKPNLGGAQFDSHAWVEPIVSDLPGILPSMLMIVLSDCHFHHGGLLDL